MQESLHDPPFQCARAARNVMLDEFRAQTNQKSSLVVPVDPSDLVPLIDDRKPAIEVMIYDEDAAAAARWVQSLPPRERALIEGIFFEGVPQSAMADRLRLTPARVSPMKHALLDAARRTIDPSMN